MSEQIRLASVNTFGVTIASLEIVLVGVKTCPSTQRQLGMNDSMNINCVFTHDSIIICIIEIEVCFFSTTQNNRLVKLDDDRPCGVNLGVNIKGGSITSFM